MSTGTVQIWPVARHWSPARRAGSGNAIADGFAAAGAALVLNGSDRGRLATAASALRDKGYNVTEACLRRDERVCGIAVRSQRSTPTGIAIDILVNNAGIQLRKPLVELSVAEWQRVIDTNLTSAFVDRPRGGAADDHARQGRQDHQHRLADERGGPRHGRAIHRREGRHQAADTRDGGRMGRARHQANAIGPGYMMTEMNKALIENPTFDAWVKGRTPARRWGKPEELVGAAVFLASAASDYVNGQIIYVDGGMLAVL